MSSFFRCFHLLVLTLTLTACSNFWVKRDAWPKNMPSKAYFLSIYNADEKNKSIQNPDEYLTWILRFYKGWELYSRGWIKMTSELLEQVENPNQVNEIKFKIDRIGRLVSGEWAKKSQDRTIYLRHVSIWGNALLKSLEFDQPLPLINQVNRDVDDLLAHKIKPDIITASRYFPEDPNDPFL
jgi:hypothetical protein